MKQINFHQNEVGDKANAQIEQILELKGKQELCLNFAGAAKVLLKIASGSKISLIEKYKSSEVELQIQLEADAELISKIMLQGDILINTKVDLAQGANYKGELIHLSGDKIIHKWIVNLAGSESDFGLKGLLPAKLKQDFEQNIEIRHLSNNCHSDVRFKAVLSDQAKTNCSGKIYVAPNACNNNAKFKNQNLLMGPKAQAYGKPALEIYNDQVQCSHGATMGNLEQEAIFYLETRGLKSSSIEQLLVGAFIEDLHLSPILLELLLK